MLTACLWKFGVAPTSPDPLWHPDALSHFDASSALIPDPVSKSSVPIKVSRYLGNVLAKVAGFCNALCKVGSVPGFAPVWAAPGHYCMRRTKALISVMQRRPARGARFPFSCWTATLLAVHAPLSMIKVLSRTS